MSVTPSHDTIDKIVTRTFEVPTDRPESDGTFAWASTTIVIVEISCRDRTGLGYTYGPRAVAQLIDDDLGEVVRGSDPLCLERTWETMHASLRNAGQTGVGAMAISALDIALHDLRARLLDIPLMAELGAVRDHVPIYGSGGFTSYGPEHVAEQLDGWVQQGIPRVKIKVGREPDQDPARLDAARAAIGSRVELMVDANGAYYPDTALAWAERLAAEWGVTWFEEPVTQDDPVGLRWVRERAPTRLAIASGEYSWNRYDIARLLDAGSVDVAQADVTRCCGLTELARIDVLCAGACRPLSLHCAPGISAHAGCALTQLRHLEYFHDHVRIESMLFDGVLSPSGGTLRPDPGCSGHGLNLRLADAEQYAVG